MPKEKAKYPEIKEIQKDAKSIKENIATLKDHAVEDIKANGSEKISEIKETVAERANMISESGQIQMDRVESYVKEKPLQSVGIAFAAGLALSALIGRR